MKKLLHKQIVVKFEDANSKLNWGERDQILLDLAVIKYKEHRHRNAK